LLSILLTYPRRCRTPFPYTTLFRSYQHPYGLHTPYQGSAEAPTPHHDVRSSSVVSGVDGVERLASYVHWLVRKNPTLVMSLFERSEEHTSELQSLRQLV